MENITEANLINQTVTLPDMFENVTSLEYEQASAYALVVLVPFGMIALGVVIYFSKRYSNTVSAQNYESISDTEDTFLDVEETAFVRKTPFDPQLDEIEESDNDPYDDLLTQSSRLSSVDMYRKLFPTLHSRDKFIRQTI
mgnify:CR=1 FL=1